MNLDAAPPRASAAQIAELSDFLRLPGGGEEDAALMRVLACCAEAATLEVERRAGVVLLKRRHALRLPAWPGAWTALPTGPAVELLEVVTETADGGRSVQPRENFVLERLVRPARVRLAEYGSRPATEPGGFVEIAYVAGLAGEWTELPADMRMATTQIAASYFEDGPSASPSRSSLSAIESRRQVRL